MLSSQVDALDKEALGAINGYNPGLSGAWMLQRAMSIRVGQQAEPDFINQLLSKNFEAMQRNGDATLRPFLQVHPTISHWKPPPPPPHTHTHTHTASAAKNYVHQHVSL